MKNPLITIILITLSFQVFPEEYICSSNDSNKEEISMVSYQRSENGRFFKRFRENNVNLWTNHKILDEGENYLILNKTMNVPGTFLTIIKEENNKFSFMEVYLLIGEDKWRNSPTGKCILKKTVTPKNNQ